MQKYKKPVLILAGILAAIVLFAITILPLILRNQAVKAIKEASGRPVRIEKVSFNPFSLTVTVSGFGIDDKGGSPFVGMEKLRVSLASVSIFKRALVIDEVTIDSPSISFARLATNSYSFSDIIERLKAPPKKESKGEFRFSINNISVHNGSLNFDDRAVDGGRKHSITNLEVAIPFFSNIPYLAEKYTNPKFSAVVNGAAFSFGGKVKPLSKSMETSVRIDLKQLDLPHYAAYAPHKIPVNLASGTLSTDVEVNYKVSADKKPELNLKGSVRLDNMAFNLRDGRSLLKIPSLQIDASRIDLFTRQFAFNTILLDGLEFFASRDGKGEWMYSNLLPKSEKTKSDKSEKTVVSVASFIIKNGSVHFSDAVPPGGFRTTLSEIDVTAQNISTAADTKADYEFSMLLDNEANFSADGNFSIAPLAATLSAELRDIKIQKGWPYLAQFLTAPVKGTLGTSLDLTYNKDGLKVENGKLLLKGLSARYGDKEGFDLALLEVEGILFDQKKNRAEAASIRLSKGDISLSREPDGSISLLALLKKSTADSQQSTSGKVSDKKQVSHVSPVTAADSGGKNSSKPLSWSLKRFQLDRFNSSFTDKSRDGNPFFNLRNSQLILTNLNGPKFTPAGFKFTSTLNRETPLKASGELTPLPFRYKGELSIGRLHIRDFEDYFPDNINVFVIGGTVDTLMNLDIALNEGKPNGSFKGSIGVRSFHSIDAVAEEDLLKWESLQLDEIQGTLVPFSLAIREVSLSNLYSRIEVRKDGTLNLQNLIDKPEADTQVPAKEHIKDNTKAKSPISIGAVTIQEGTISFTDRHLPQTFSSTFFNMGGRVSGLSSEESILADVDLRGNLENHSPLQITGRINPLRDDLFVDLKVSFKDIDLSPVTHYSGTYLGYTVEKGKLFLDLKYLIDKKQLNSENNIFIDQFTFGTKVESEKATSLPVWLAVALLKDRKGEIHLKLPVTGRTDDPKFSIWGVVWQVFKNMIVKAATSPFALLSSMFGGGEDFSSVKFDVGSSSLSAPEEKKLAALSKVLADRPGLKMEIKGYVEREKDAEGYRRELLNGKLQNEKFLELAKERKIKDGENADAIRITPEEISGLMKAVYKKEKFPKPRNVVGLVKDLTDEDMRKLIIANTLVGEPELQKLARERATSVMDYLVTKGGLPAERLFQKNDDIHKAPEKESTGRSRVEFNAIAQ
jgi:flagellar motor protein MotB